MYLPCLPSVQKKIMKIRTGDNALTLFSGNRSGVNVRPGLTLAARRRSEPTLDEHGLRSLFSRGARTGCPRKGAGHRTAIGGEVIPSHRLPTLQRNGPCLFLTELPIDLRLEDPAPDHEIVAPLGKTRLEMKQRILSGA